MYRTMCIRLLSLALLCGALLAAPTRTVGAEAVVEAAATTVPGTYEFLATGFADNEAVSVWLTGPSQQVQAADGQQADGRGTVSFTLQIPRHFEAGRWATTVHGLDSGDEAIGTFAVAARGADLTLSVSPTSGPAGTTFTFAGDGFAGNEMVSYWLTGPDGRTYEGGVVNAGSAGAVGFDYTVGAETQSGAWTMSAYGQSSDHLAVGVFTVA